LIGVLVSGTGTNLQALIDDGLPISGVISSKPDAPALERAARAGIPHETFALHDHADRDLRDAAMADWLEERHVELVVLAGFMWLLRPAFLERFPRRIINTHPALLPAFAGAHAIEQALEYGARWTGVTVHFVDEGLDSGEIILQEPVPIADDETVESLREKIQAVEHVLLPEACRLALGGKLQLAEGSRRVRIEQ
jgi:phosphoribosylglycinamide formyltransferase-1